MIYEQALGPIGGLGSSIVWLVEVTVTEESTADDHKFKLIPTIWSDVFLPADASSTCMRICTLTRLSTEYKYFDRSDGNVIDGHTQSTEYS